MKSKATHETERRSDAPVYIRGRWVWLTPNTTTHECQHVELGACDACRYPMLARTPSRGRYDHDR